MNVLRRFLKPKPLKIVVSQQVSPFSEWTANETNCLALARILAGDVMRSAMATLESEGPAIGHQVPNDDIAIARAYGMEEGYRMAIAKLRAMAIYQGEEVEPIADFADANLYGEN